MKNQLIDKMKVKSDQCVFQSLLKSNFLICYFYENIGFEHDY